MRAVTTKLDFTDEASQVDGVFPGALVKPAQVLGYLLSGRHTGPQVTGAWSGGVVCYLPHSLTEQAKGGGPPGRDLSEGSLGLCSGGRGFRPHDVVLASCKPVHCVRCSACSSSPALHCRLCPQSCCALLSLEPSGVWPVCLIPSCCKNPGQGSPSLALSPSCLRTGLGYDGNGSCVCL